jgi:OOP family OmpA-OmpF porin
MSTQSLIPPKPSSSKLTDEEWKEEQAKIAELRALLLGTERAQAVRLKPHLDKIEPKDLSRVLPTAIRLRNAQDQVLTDALMPTVAAALKVAVKRDPQAVASAIFPIMAPAIRQAIATTFNQLVQSLDRALQYSLSWQGLKWRFEAWRTGKSFAEVVLYHTLLFRVDYVFLIHRETGLLLQHVSRDGAEGQNAEVISGMMSAIKSAWQDFVHDSFGSDPKSFLSELRVGDYNIWFEQGPHLVLACVIRGSAPQGLRTDFMAPAIEAIHREQADEIAKFDGDPDPFVTTRHHLENCLQTRYHKGDEQDTSRFRLSPRIWIPAALLLILAGTWLTLLIRDEWQWNKYLRRLENEPGILVTETGSRGRRFFVSGFRDPLAPNPEQLLKESGSLSPDKVYAKWQSYHSLHPDFVMQRLTSVLAPPPTIKLSLQGEELIATGVASRQWIADVQRLAPSMAGVSKVHVEGVMDEEILRFKAKMEQEVPRFIVGTSRFAPGQDSERTRLIEDARALFALANSNNVKVKMTIVGHTDDTGTVEFNDKLSLERAQSVRTLLVDAGIDGSALETIGVGSREPIKADSASPGVEINRSVTFRVAVNEPANPSRAVK